ncbi:hypothetical protein BDF22DRAFT_689984 [Syncephalis plumigaleata]|nr:hypothetical protein BDF22DRAFT_689984 [Syncephalis plumigaleata]
MSSNNGYGTAQTALPTSAIANTTESSISHTNDTDTVSPDTGHDPLETSDSPQTLPLTIYNTNNNNNNNSSNGGRRQVLSASLPTRPFLPFDRANNGTHNSSSSIQVPTHLIDQTHHSDSDDIGDKTITATTTPTTAITAALPSLNGFLRPSTSHATSNRHTLGHASSYFTNMSSNNNINSSNSPRLLQRDSLGSAGWRRLRRYIMHHQPNWAHTSPGNDLPPLPLPMTPGRFSASSPSPSNNNNSNNNNRNSTNPFGLGLIDWQDSLEPVVHVVLDDGTIRKRRMTSRSFSESEDVMEKNTPFSLQQEISATMTRPSLSSSSSSSSTSSSESATEQQSSSKSTGKHQYRSMINSNSSVSNNSSNQPRYTTYTSTIRKWYDCIPLKYRRTLKASFAYFIGSLATFWEVPFEWIGGQSTHLAALSIFFFNPARTRGALLESVLFGLIGMVYGCLITSIVALSVVNLNIHGYTTLSKWVGVIGVGGIGTFGVAAAKAWLKRPSVYTAGSVASLTMYVGLARIIADEPHVKQIDWDALIGPQQAFFTVVNYTIWTQKASNDLRNDVASTLQSFNGLLRILVKTFLLDDNAPVDALPTALAAHRQSFSSLKKSLHEAQLEPADPIWPQLPAYANLIDSLNILTQHISSLSSCVGLQREVLTQQRLNKVVATLIRKNKPTTSTRNNDDNGEASNHPTDKGKQPIDTGDQPSNTTSYNSAKAHLDTQGEEELRIFLEGIGPVMRALSYTCKRTMTQMHRSITTGALVDANRLQSNLALALVHFNREKSIALHFAHQLEKVIEQFNQLQMDRNRSWWTALKERIKNNWPSNELLFDVGDDARVEIVWQKFDPKSMQDTLHSPRPKTALQRFSFALVKFGDMLKQFKMRYAIKSAIFAMLLIAPAFMDDWRETYQNYRGEWSVISMAVVMTPTVGGSNIVGIYRIIGTVCGSLVAYLAYTLFPGSRTILPCVAFLFSLPCFHLIMYSGYPRVGQVSCMTFTTVLMSRYAVYEDDELEIRDVALTRAITVTLGAIIGLFATTYVWPYEARVELRRGLCDFFINLNLLYHKMVSLYSKSWLEEDISVDEGSPYDESTPLRTTIRLNETDRMARSYKQFLALELLLQLKLLQLQDLLALTRNEPRLKGPFPVGAYGRLLGHCQALIDHMLTLRMTITDVNWVQQVRRNFIQPVQKERRQMIGAMELYMYSVAAALLLKMPVPAYLPPITETWHNLIARVRQLPEMHTAITLSSRYHGQLDKEQTGASHSLQEDMEQWHMEDERFILYFAYVLVTGDVVHELEGVGACLRELYGVMGGSQAQFEACFDA